MSANPEYFTCVTCNVAFNNSDIQRDHYKTDWHRYNLKRKVADLPAVSIEDFMQRVQIQKKQLESSQNQAVDEYFCKLCSKHFTTANSFANHKQSKKHKDLEVEFNRKKGDGTENLEQEGKPANEEYVVKSDRSIKKAAQLEEMRKKLGQDNNMEEVTVEEDEDDKEWEDVDEDEDGFDESNGIDLNTCLFCEHKSNSLENKVLHMAKDHSFFVPDSENVSDLEGLMKFLGVKVGAYHVCLWCSSKCYRDVLSVQHHMLDKGHQKIRFEGETLLEYADFYTFEGEDEEDEDEDFEVISDEETDNRIVTYNKNRFTSTLTDENFELVLPSGIKIGHRSLARYYKQSFGHRSLEMKQRNNVTIKDKYKAIASNSAYNHTEIQKQRKDIAYLQRWKSKMSAKLGWEANKLQKHFRRQDLCF